jgi:hypothetical protein
MSTLSHVEGRPVQPCQRETGVAGNDINLLAAARLEAAVERWASALEAARLANRRHASVANMVPKAEVEALAAKLDETLARRRSALDDGEG